MSDTSKMTVRLVYQGGFHPKPNYDDEKTGYIELNAWKLEDWDPWEAELQQQIDDVLKNLWEGGVEYGSYLWVRSDGRLLAQVTVTDINPDDNLGIALVVVHDTKTAFGVRTGFRKVKYKIEDGEYAGTEVVDLNAE